MNEIIRSLAQENNVVIIGRASEITLKEFPGVFHIRVVAPLDLRIRRVMERYDISHHEAAKAIARSDKNRSEYVRTFYHADIDDPLLYDLMLNTNKLDIDEMVKYVAEIIKNVLEK
jgi:cytidylate kinase